VAVVVKKVSVIAGDYDDGKGTLARTIRDYADIVSGLEAIV
jgi:hypothetical protein